MTKIGFAGTDARTLVSALVVSTASSEVADEKFRGVVVRGNRAMERFAEIMDWPVKFISTTDNSGAAYANAIINAFKNEELDGALIMPEDLLYQGVVDKIIQAGFGERVVGLDASGALKIEGDKISGKMLSRMAGVPVADEWKVIDVRDYQSVLSTCLKYIDRYGGAYLKFPFSAQGKGSRGVFDIWEIKEVYNQLLDDYRDKYKEIRGNNLWPLLIESLMSGAEISFTVLVDKNGNFQILPPAMDYPRRFALPPGPNNPVTGGMGAVSPHPLGTPEVVEMAKEKIVRPFVEIMRSENILRPCVLYPGCFLSLDEFGKPSGIRVSEWNARPGEPEFQVVAKRIRNLGALIKAVCGGKLDEIEPEIRVDQVSMTVALVTGPGGPQNQKGYPWSCTTNELIDIDFEYFKKKKISLIPSAMDYNEADKTFRGGGSRPAYLLANTSVKSGQRRYEAAEVLRQKLLRASDEGKIRMIPRENPEGNRLDLRNDIGRHYKLADETFPY